MVNKPFAPFGLSGTRASPWSAVTCHCFGRLRLSARSFFLRIHNLESALDRPGKCGDRSPHSKEKSVSKVNHYFPSDINPHAQPTCCTIPIVAARAFDP